MAQKSNKRALVAEHPYNSSEMAIATSDIAALAYELWQQRGCPEGSPEEDWYQAERKVQSQTPNQNQLLLSRRLFIARDALG